MNKQEFGIIVKTLRASYPNNSFLDDQGELGLWYSKMKDISYETASKAVDVIISGASEYPPSLPQMLNKCREQLLPEFPTTSEAWEMVLTAATTYGTTHWEKAMESIPEPVRTVARGEMFRQICLSEDQTATMRHFMTRYKDYVEKCINGAMDKSEGTGCIECNDAGKISGEVAEEEQNTVPELKNGVSSERLMELKRRAGLI